MNCPLCESQLGDRTDGITVCTNEKCKFEPVTTKSIMATKKYACPRPQTDDQASMATGALQRHPATEVLPR